MTNLTLTIDLSYTIFSILFLCLQNRLCFDHNKSGKDAMGLGVGIWVAID